MKLGIIGSRDWPVARERHISDYIQSLPKDTIIVTGGWPTFAGGYWVVEATKGVDRIAWTAAERVGLVTCLVAGSKTVKKNLAGIQRNPAIVTLSDALAAFWDGESRGTARTLTAAMQAGKQPLVIGLDGAPYELEAWVGLVRALKIDYPV
jgi:hypothetical protein